ncbi:MAG: DUF1648 domain-containing protein [Clostridiales bacterium]|nr:DUF1648 domain-containing protein [Clostridiales bacterium]
MNKDSEEQKLELPLMPLELVFQALAVMGLVFLAVIFIALYKDLPEIIPTHFNIAGEPDAWGSKSSLIFLAALPVFMFALITVLERFPKIWNMPVQVTKENAVRQYTLARAVLTLIKAEIVWLFTFIFYFTCQVALGNVGGMGWWLYAFFALIVATPVALIIIARKTNKI